MHCALVSVLCKGTRLLALHICCDMSIHCTFTCVLSSSLSLLSPSSAKDPPVGYRKVSKPADPLTESEDEVFVREEHQNSTPKYSKERVSVVSSFTQPRPQSSPPLCSFLFSFSLWWSKKGYSDKHYHSGGP